MSNNYLLSPCGTSPRRCRKEKKKAEKRYRCSRDI